MIHRRFFFLIFIFLLIFISPVIFAQIKTISGTVIDYNTNNPIVDVHVKIKGTNQTSTTNFQGKYTLNIPDSIVTIEFDDFLGMDVKQIKTVSNQVIDIYLLETSIMNLTLQDLLNLTVTTAGKKEQPITDIPASVEVIDRTDIEKMGYIYLKDIIRNIPGYYVMSNLGIDIIGVRGFVKDKGLNFVVLMNGINITDDQLFGYYDLPVQVIDKIEIIRGPMAVIYGDNAFFGAINIITNAKTEESSAQKLSFMTGSNAFQNDFVHFSGTHQQLKYTLNGSFQRSNGPEFDLTKMIKDPSRLDFPFYGGPNNNGLDVPADMRTTSNRLNWNEKYFDFNLIDQNFYTNLVYIESFRKRYYYFPSLNDGSSTETRKGSISIGYKKIINSNLSFDTKATYDRIYRRNIYNIITPNFNGIETYHVAKFQIQSDVLWKINPFVDITSGLDVHSILENLNEGDVPLGGSPNYRFYNIHPNDRSNLLTGYIQTEIKKIPKLLIVAGIRVEKQFGYQLLYHYDLALTTDTIYKGVREGEQLNFFPDWL